MTTLTTTALRHIPSPSERRQLRLARASGRQPTARSDSLADMPDPRIDWERVRMDADKLLAALCWPSPAGA